MQSWIPQSVFDGSFWRSFLWFRNFSRSSRTFFLFISSCFFLSSLTFAFMLGEKSFLSCFRRRIAPGDESLPVLGVKWFRGVIGVNGPPGERKSWSEPVEPVFDRNLFLLIDRGVRIDLQKSSSESSDNEIGSWPEGSRTLIGREFSFSSWSEPSSEIIWTVSSNLLSSLSDSLEK